MVWTLSGKLAWEGKGRSMLLHCLRQSAWCLEAESGGLGDLVFISPCLLSSELTQQVMVLLTQLCRSAKMHAKELSPT